MKYDRLKEGIYPFNAGSEKNDPYGFTGKLAVGRAMRRNDAVEDQLDDDRDEKDDEKKERDTEKERADNIKKINEPEPEDENAVDNSEIKERYVDTYEGRVLTELEKITCDINRLDYLKEFFSYFEESLIDAYKMLNSDYGEIILERCQKYNIRPIICANKIYQRYLQEKWQNIQEQ